jgi:hypothetical protein
VRVTEQDVETERVFECECENDGVTDSDVIV